VHASCQPNVFRRNVSLFTMLLTLTVSALAIRIGLGNFLTSAWWATTAEIAAQPELPLLVLLRTALVAIGLWVMVPGVVAVAAHALGLRHVAEKAIALLPGVVAAVFRRTLRVGLVGVLVFPNAAGAADKVVVSAPASAAATSTSAFATAVSTKPSITVRPSETEQAAGISSGAYRLDVSTGQLWPVGLPPRPDPDAPRLLGPPAPHDDTDQLPGNPAERVAGVVSVPQSGTAVRLDDGVQTPTTNPGPRTPEFPDPTTETTSETTSETTTRALQPPELATTRPRTYAVVAGDHLWSIARRTMLSERRDATEPEIGSYARRLIEANRMRLPNPANPDLLLVGIELVLPDL
jgi:hypothetical protein